MAGAALIEDQVQPHTALGRYTLKRELGRGGMGVVYLASDANTGRDVALKTASVAQLGSEASRHQRRHRFVREVQALTQVSHDNVVRVYDAGEADHEALGWVLYYAMEFVDGLTLADLVKKHGPLPPAAACEVVRQVALGLGAAHKKGIVHRDVKPANVFLSLDGRALIGDFGICKIEGSTQITRRDQLVGTPNYLAPEQILGDEVSPHTDVFALASLYFIVTTNRPMRPRVDATALLDSARSNDVRDRMANEASLPGALRSMMAQALERVPERRYADGDAFAVACAPYADARALQDLLRSADPQAASAQSDVERAAQHLLQHRPQAPQQQAPPAKTPLPIAKTEATAIFHMRVLEAEAVPMRAGGLAVAKTEKTGMFMLSDAFSAAAPPMLLEPLNALSEPTAQGGPLRPGVVAALEERTDDTASRVRRSPPTAVRRLDALVAALPPSLREPGAWVGVLVGLALGLLIALFGR